MFYILTFILKIHKTTQAETTSSFHSYESQAISTLHFNPT
jgi:hypothetical protein